MNRILGLFVKVGIMLVVFSFVVAFNSGNANAVSCNLPPAGAGMSGPPLLSFSASGGPVDSSVKQLASEFRPSQSWSDQSYFYSYIGAFVKANCVESNASIQYTVEGRKVTVNYSDYEKSNFQVNTDYKSLASGVVATSSNGGLGLVYNLPAATTIAAGESFRLSVDLDTELGWARVVLEVGDEIEVSLARIQLPVGAVSFSATNDQLLNAYYSLPDFDGAGTTCSGVTGARSVAVRALADDQPIAMRLTQDSRALCKSYDRSSYDAANKTIIFAYDASGGGGDRGIVDLYDLDALIGFDSSGMDASKQRGSLSVYSNLGNFEQSDRFYSSSNNAQQLYFVAHAFEKDLKIPEDKQYPIAGGVFDFANGDLDLGAAGVSFDTSSSLYATVAHNFNKVTKDGQFTLFAPVKEGDTYVGVCPGAEKIDQVNTTCNSLYFLEDGQEGNGAKAEIVDIDGISYWRVDGLTGTGVFSSTIGEIPGVSNTGLTNQSNGYILLVSAVAVLVTGGSLVARRFNS